MGDVEHSKEEVQQVETAMARDLAGAIGGILGCIALPFVVSAYIWVWQYAWAVIR